MIAGSDKYRYYVSLDNGSFWQTLKLANYPKITYSRDGNQYFIRKKSDPWKFVRYENAKLYDAILLLLSDISSITNEISVKIDVYTDFVTLDRTEFLGYIPLSGISINEDNGVITLDPTPKDNYDWIDKYGDTKILWKDIIEDVGTLNQVKYKVTGEHKKLFSCWNSAVSSGPYTPNGYVLSNEYPDDWATGRHYHRISIYSTTSAILYTGYGDNRSFCTIWQFGTPYIFACISTHTSTTPPVPGISGSQGGWVEVGRNGAYLNNLTYNSYSQQQLRVPAPYYTNGDGLYDAGFPFITSIDEPVSNCAVGTFYRSYGTVDINLEWDYGTRFIELKALIGYFLSTTRNGIEASGFTLSSKFFTESTNPLSAANPNPFKIIQVAPSSYIMPSVGMNMGEVETITVNTNGVNYNEGDVLYVVQASPSGLPGNNTTCVMEVIAASGTTGGLIELSIIDPGQWYTSASNLDVSNPSSSGSGAKVNIKVKSYIDSTSEYTINEILNDIASTFDCYYFINDSDEFILEHRKYFEQDFDYGAPPVATIDLTDTSTYPVKYQTIFDIDGTGSDKEYSWNGVRIPKFEKFIYRQSNLADGVIEYDSPLALASDTEDHNVQMFSVDLELVGRTPDKHSENGLAVICCDSSGYVLKRTTVVEDIETTNVMNGDLYWDNLLNDYWKYYRYFTHGYINKGDTYTYVFYEKTFSLTRPIKTFSQKRLKTQRQVVFPQIEKFDPYKLIKTNLGTGLPKESELSTETDFIRTTLLYV